MLKFLEPTIEDKQWAKPIFLNSGYIGSDNTFGNSFIWKDAYKLKICRYNDFLLRIYGDDKVTYGFPLGKGNLQDIINILIDDASKRGEKLSFVGLTTSMFLTLNKIMPDAFIFKSTRDTADYIYGSSDLINLKGKKYHKKRNHISKFKTTHDFIYDDISKENIDDCRVILKQWYSENDYKDNESLCNEKRALELALDNFTELEFIGGIIRVGGLPVALTIGEKINNDVFVVHFEKALKEYRSVYAIINNEFAKRNLSVYKYINREEDLGLEGLRKAKMSYYPQIILEKYIATLR